MTQSTTLDDAIHRRLRAILAPLRVVYGAMFGSILVYWIVVQAIRKVGQIPRGRDVFDAVAWLRYPLYVLGAAACVAVLVLRRRLFDPEGVIRRARGRNLPELLSTLSSNQVLIFAVGEIPVIPRAERRAAATRRAVARALPRHVAASGERP